MGFLSKIAYNGSLYRYFYWFDNIDGQWYLFFQPFGMGKVWKDLIYSVISIKELYEEILNNIIVWGNKRYGYYPQDGDYWTEKDLTGWGTVAVGGSFLPVSLSMTDSNYITVQSGEKALEAEVTYNGLTDWGYFWRTLNKDSQNYVNMETFAKLYFKYSWEDHTYPSDARVVLFDANGVYNYKSLTLTASYPTWYSINITDKGTGASGWTSINNGGTFDWTQVKKLEFQIRGGGSSGASSFYLDNLYFITDPVKSENTGSSSGYDATSAGLYGKREPYPIYVNWLKTTAACNKFAASLLGYYKDPQYQVTIKLEGFYPFSLADKIAVNFYGKELELPVNTIKWQFKDKVITTVNLGHKRKTLSDIFEKISMDFVDAGTDWGNQYYLY